MRTAHVVSKPVDTSAHTCVIREDGSVWCWGSNSRGQLGVGGGGDRDDPTLVTF